MVSTIVSKIFDFLPTKYLYAAIALFVISICTYAYFHYTNLVTTNKLLDQKIITLEENQTKIIDAYEYSIKVIETTTKVEAQNEASKQSYEVVFKKLEKAKENKKYEVINDTNYVDFSF